MINKHSIELPLNPARKGADPQNPFQRNVLGSRAGSQSYSGLIKLPHSKSHYLLEAACKVARASFGGVGFLSAMGELVENPAWGVSETVANELSESPWLAGLIQAALKESEPQHLHGPACAAHFGVVPPGTPAVGSLLVIPLARPGRLRGALYLARSPGQPAFSLDDLEAVMPLTVCLEQGNLLEEASLQAQLRLLNRVAQAAAGNLDLAPIFEATLRELDRCVPMSVCAVWLVETQTISTSENQPEPAVGESSRPAPGKLGSAQEPAPEFLRLAAVSPGARASELGLVSGMQVPLAQTPFASCWQAGSGAVYTEWQGGRDLAARHGGATPPATYPSFATPLRAGDRTVGILQSVCNRPTGFKSEQVQLLYLVADLLGPAISNCQLFGRLRITYDELRNTQAQLIRNEKLRALGELSSGMAHDFNNALCGVLGFLEITLLDKQLGASSRGNLELARTCAQDAASTVHRIQDFARARPEESVFEPIYVSEVVRGIVELTRPKWENLERRSRKAIDVQLYTETEATILGNAAEIREVLTNLIFNAVDAMPDGGTLTVRTWSEGETVFISVADTGLGMSAAVQQRLFEPFFTTKGERGNGLGLSVAFGIIRRHGGDITVTSEIGRGSTFCIRLGAASSGMRSHTANRTQGNAPPGPLAAPSLRILVVEDEQAIRSFLGTALTGLGHRPRLTRCGGEALKAFGEERFDIVLTDMGLPDITGEEVTRQIVTHIPGTPVILLTGWADQIKSQARPLEGVTCVLGKPISIQPLADAILAAFQSAPKVHPR